MGRIPSLAYYNHAPLLAWLLIPLHWIGEASTMGIRNLASIFNILTNITLIVLLIKIIHKEQNKNSDKKNTNLFADEILSHPSVVLFAWVLLISPIILIAGTIWTSDTPLFLFLSLCLLAFYTAYSSEELSGLNIAKWLPCGIFFGLAILSKYSAVVWGGSAFLFLLATKQGRTHLTTVGPWFAFFISLLFLTPVIVWNIQREWVSFSFVLKLGFGAGTPEPLFLLGGLLIVLGPALFFVIIRGYLANKKLSDDFLFLHFVAFIPLLFFLSLGFITQIYLNWLGFSALIMLMLFSIYIYRFPKFARLNLYLHSIFQLAVVVTIFYIVYAPLPIVQGRVFEYQEIKPKLEELQAKYPNAYFYGTDYGMHAILNYVQEENLPYSYAFGFNNHFEYIDDTIPQGADIVLFSTKNSMARYSKFFDELITLEPVDASYRGKFPTRIYIYLGRNNTLGREHQNNKL